MCLSNLSASDLTLVSTSSLSTSDCLCLLAMTKANIAGNSDFLSAHVIVPRP